MFNTNRLNLQFTGKYLRDSQTLAIRFLFQALEAKLSHFLDFEGLFMNNNEWIINVPMQTACIDGDFELHPSSKVLRVHFAFSWSFNSSFLTFSRAANNSFFNSALWLNLMLVPIYESQSTSQHYDSFIGNILLIVVMHVYKCNRPMKILFSMV